MLDVMIMIDNEGSGCYLKRSACLKTIFVFICTGLYAESHNIIGNFFYDSNQRNKFELFNRSSTSLIRWWEAEPIWTTATKHGRKVGTFLWAR